MSDITTPPPPEPAPGVSYPVELELQRDLRVARWRPLVNWLFVIPLAIVLYLLSIASGWLWIVSFFTVLFTKRNPFVGFQAMVLRYTWRLTSFAFFMRHEYPAFEFDIVATDPGTDPAVVSVEEPGDMNRWMVLVKWLLLIPHFIVLTFLFIAVVFVWIIAFFAVIITGGWPQSLREFVIGVMRWSTRVNAYFDFLTDAYPPFSLR